MLQISIPNDPGHEILRSAATKENGRKPVAKSAVKATRTNGKKPVKFNLLSMKNFRIVALFLGCLVSSCDNPLSEKQRLPKSAEDSVLAPIQNPDFNGKDSTVKPIYVSKLTKAFLDFQTAVFNEDADGVNQFIDQEHGVYLIENPGAMPKMTNVKDIRKFKREFQGLSFFSIKDRLKTCQLREEDLPTFNCDGTTDGNTGYSKAGCFAADAEEFRKNEIYKYASLPEAEMKSIEATLPLVTKTIVQTSSSYRFHFGYLNNAWKVLFIDLRIPCSA